MSELNQLSLTKAVATTRSPDDRPALSALHGIPIGIKDIIDTADMPTTMGSPIYTDNHPQYDANCVSAYRPALRLAADWFHQLKMIFHQVDVLIAPSTTGEAPLGLDNTGDPLFSRMWNLLGVPSITLPAGTGSQGLPLGLQVIGQYRDDDHLIQVANWIQRVLSSNSQISHC